MFNILNKFLVLSVFLCGPLFSLPEKEEVVSGAAEFYKNEKFLQIKTSDRAIINYEKFHIGQNEKVEFIQPSSRSRVLNRVVGKDPSQILGSLKSNGTVFLVNPEGIYFGPHANVNVGSFVASTLSIKDEDFLSDHCKFYLEKNASIVNEGIIQSDGFIGLFSPHIENKGSILAHAEKIFLGSAERITLDFSDGIKFTIDGDLQNALIKNYGEIESKNGDLLLSLRSAKKAIKMVVNTEGIYSANAIEEREDGIYLANNSSIKGSNVQIEAPLIKSSANVSSTKNLLFSADKLFLEGSVNAQKDLTLLAKEKLVLRDKKEEPTVLSSKGNLKCESSCIDLLILSHPDSKIWSGHDLNLISENPISADAHFFSSGDFALIKPDGLPADFVSFYDPIISATAGVSFGNYNGVSLKVEAVNNIFVNGNVTISGVDSSASLSDTDGATMRAQAAFILRTGPIQGFGLPVPPNQSRGGATFARDATAGSNIYLASGANINIITANGGTVIMSTPGGSGVRLRRNVNIRASGAGNVSVNISAPIDSDTNARTLVVDAGTSTVNFGRAVGSSNAVRSLTMTNSGALTFGSSLNLTGNFVQTNAATGSTTFNGAVTIASATLRGTTFNINDSWSTTGATAVTNSGLFTKNATGTITTTGNFTTTGNVNLANNIVTTNNTLSIGGSLTVAEGASPTLQSGNGALTVTGLINGTAGGVAESLILNAPAGVITLGSIGSGSATSLANLTITNSAAINFNGAINITGSLTQTNAATGTTTFANTVSVGSAALMGTIFNINNSWNSSGLTSITNSGLITKNSTGAITAAGGFTTSGNLNLASNITTTNSTLSIGGNLTIASGLSLTLQSGNGSLTVSGTIDGTAAGAAEILTLNALGGIINLGTVGSGSTTSLTTLNITNSAALNFNGAISLTGDLTQTNPATGTTIFGSTVSVASASLNGTAFNINNSWVSSGSTNITNSGLLTKNSTGAITATGGFTVTGNVNLANNIATTNTPLTIGGTLTVANGTTPILQSNNGNITLANVDASTGSLRTITLNGGTGTVQVGAVGTLTTSEFASVVLTGGDLKIRGNIITNSLTLTPGVTNTIFLGGGITTTSSAITFSRPVIRDTTANIILDTSASNNTISFNSTLDGAIASTYNMTLNSGSGGITFTGAVGTTSLNNITFTHSGALTFSSSLNLSGALTQTNPATGTTTFGSTVSVASASLNGTIFNINNSWLSSGSTNITNSGLLTKNSTGAITATGGFTVTGNVNLANNIATTNTPLTIGGTLTVANGTTPILQSNNGNITLANVDASTGSLRTITLNGGTGTVQVGAVGTLTTSEFASVVLTGGDLKIRGNIITNSLTLIPGVTNTIFLGGGITTTSGAITFPRPVIRDTTANIILDTSASNNTISFNSTLDGAIASTYNMTLNSGSGGITFTGAVGTTSLNNITFTHSGALTFSSSLNLSRALTQTNPATGTTTFGSTVSIGSSSLNGTIFNINNSWLSSGSTAITNSGLLTKNSTGAITATGGFTVTGNVNLANNIATTNTPLTIGGTLTIAEAVSSTLQSGSGALTVSGLIDGILGGVAESLILNAPGGIINLGNIGSGSPTKLTSLTITNSAAINFNGIINITGPLMQSNTATGNATFFKDVTVGSASLQASSFIMNEPPLLTFTSLGGNILFLSGNIQLSTGSNFTMSSSGGNITTNDIHAGITDLRTLNINAGSGNLQVGNIGSVGNQEFASVTLSGNNIIILGDVVSNSVVLNPGSSISTNADIFTNNVPIIFTKDLILLNSCTFSTGTPGAAITFNGKIDGNIADAYSLNLNSGSSGSITFNDKIGFNNRLSGLTITNANNVTAQNDIFADAIFQQNATAGGLTAFNGNITVPAVVGIQLNGSKFSFAAGKTITTLSGGPLIINNSSDLTFAAAATISGSFTQSGSGRTFLSGSIVGDQPVSFDGPITLSGSPSISTSASSQDIFFAGTIDGTSALDRGNFTIGAGSGNITFNDNIGDSIPIGVFHITNTQNMTLNGVKAESLQLDGGSGTLTTLGTLDMDGVAGIVVTGNNFSINGDIFVRGGSLTATTTGTVSGSGITIISVYNNFLQNGTGPVFVAGPIITYYGTIEFQSPATIFAPSSLDTTGGGTTVGSDIIFGALATLDGTQNLSLSAGNGNILFGAAVGLSNPLNTLTINNAHDVTTLALSAASFNQNSGTGTTTFNGPVLTTGASGISITTKSFLRGNTITTTGSGPLSVTIDSSGTFTSIASGNISLSGSFSQIGTGLVAFGGNLGTNNSSISFAGPITLYSDANFISGTGIANNITLGSTLNGAHNLTLNAGGSNISFEGDVGASSSYLTSLTIINTKNVSTQAIYASSILEQNSSGTSTFGSLNTDTSNISLTGTNFNFNGAITTLSGSFTLMNSSLSSFAVSAPINLNGPFLQNGAGQTSLANSITTTGISSSVQFSGPIIVPNLATSSLNSSANSQPINFGSTIEGPGSLSLNSGSGNITLQQDAGFVTSEALGTFSMNSSGAVTTQKIKASSITLLGASTSQFSDLVTTNGSINLTGNTITLLGNLSTTLGSIALTNSALLTTTSGKTIISDGSFTQSGGGSVNLASSISTNHQNLSFTNAISLQTSVALDTTFGVLVGSGSISLDSAVNGSFALDLTAGSGNVSMLGNIGSPLGALTIHSAVNVTFGAHLIPIYATMSSLNISSNITSGTTSFYGNFTTTGSSGYSLIGHDYFREGDLISQNGGSLIVNNYGSITHTPGNITTIDGSYLQIGSGAFNLAGLLTAIHGQISFSGPVTLVGAAILDTSTNGTNITFGSTIGGNFDLTFKASGGNIALHADVGSILTSVGEILIDSADNFTATKIYAQKLSSNPVNPIAGTLSLSDDLVIGSGGIALTGATFSFNNVTTNGGSTMSVTNSGILTFANNKTLTIDGGFSQTGTGSVNSGSNITANNHNISFIAPIILTANNILTASNPDVGFGITLGAVNGAHNLSLNASSGTIDVQGGVGLTTALTSFVTSSKDILINNVVNIAGLCNIVFDNAGTGTFNGSITSTTVNGISISGGTVNANSLITKNNGPIIISNSAILTIPFGATVSSSGPFAQSGGGNVLLGSNVTTSGNLQFGSALTLTHNVIFNSNNHDISTAAINGDINYTENLTAIAGSSGNITFGDIGLVHGLNILNIQSCHNFTVNKIVTNTLQQNAGSNLTHFQDTILAYGLSGISLTGSNFTFDQNVTVSSGGASIVHSGDLTMNPSAWNLSGVFAESGGIGSSVFIAADITDNSDVLFGRPVNLTGPITINSGIGNITFSDTIDGGSYCLDLQSLATVQMLGSVNLNCLTVSGANIIQNSIHAATGIQEIGNISLHGDISTIANNITLTGNVVLFASSNITASSGDVTITQTVNSGGGTSRDLTISASGTIDLQNVIGGIASVGNLILNGGTINFKGLGSSSPGATGITALDATSINFTGTNYNGEAQYYTASLFDFSSASTTNIISSNNPITFYGGLIVLEPSTDLNIVSNDGNVTLSDLIGSNRNLTIDADTGSILVANIGTVSDPLNSVTLTGAAVFNPDPIYPAPVINITVTQYIYVPQIYTGTVNYLQPVIIVGDNVTFTQTTSGTLTFERSLNGDGMHDCNVTIIPNAADSVVFSGPIGNVSPLGHLTIDQNNNVIFNSAVNVASFTQTNGGGTTQLNSGITSIGNVSIQTNNIVIKGNVNANDLIIDNAGTFTTPNDIIVNLLGKFDQIGLGNVSLFGSIITGNYIHFKAPLTLSGNLELNSTNNDITFDAIVTGLTDSGQNLTLTAGTGSITMSNSVGTTRLNNITINSANYVTTESVRATSLTQVNGSGITHFQDVVDINASSGINLNGNIISFDKHITSLNGPVVISSIGNFTFVSNDTFSSVGSFTKNGIGNSYLEGEMRFAGSIFFNSPVYITNTVSSGMIINTSAFNQNITFLNTIDGPGSLTVDLGILAGMGEAKLEVDGNIGDNQPLNIFTIANAHDVVLKKVKAASFSENSNGSTTINGDIVTTSGAVALTGVNFDITGNINTASNFSIVNSGNLSLTAGALTFINGSFSQTGGGDVSLSGNIATNDNTISFLNDIVLIGDVTLSSKNTLAGGAGITFLATINGQKSLEISSGVGDINFVGNVGDSTPLGSVTINDVKDITYASFQSDSLNQAFSSGTTNVNGPITTSAITGINLSGNIINQNNVLATTNSGPITINNIGLFTVGALANTNSSGPYEQTTIYPVSLGSSVFAINSSISFNGPITLTGSVSINSGPLGANTHFNSFSTIDGDGVIVRTLTLNADSGSITFDAPVGTSTRINLIINSAVDVFANAAINAHSIAQLIGTGTSNFSALNTDTSNISLTGTNFSFNGAITTLNGAFTLMNSSVASFANIASVNLNGPFLQNGVGQTRLANTITTTGASSSIQFLGPVVVPNLSLAFLNTSASSQPINFGNTIEGPGSLSLNSGSGNITLQQDVGYAISGVLGAFSINSNGTITTQKIKASSLTLTGSSASQFNDDLVTTNGAVNLSANTIILLGNLSTTLGSINIMNSGLLTTTSGKTIIADGSFTQSGGGSVNLASSVSTNHQNILFSNAISLQTAVALDTTFGAGVGSGSIGLDNTVNGSFAFDLTAGSGNVLMLGNIGTIGTPLGALTVHSADNVNMGANLSPITAYMSSLNIISNINSGTTSFYGTFTTNGSNGYNFVGYNFYCKGTFISQNGGSFTINNYGTLTQDPSNVTTMSGSYLQIGSGNVDITGLITAVHGEISFSGPVTLVGATTLDTHTGGSNITFNNVVDGTDDLTLTAGSGDALLLNTTGGMIPLNSLTITGGNIHINNIGGGSPGILGLTSLTATEDIIFNGTNYNLHAQTYIVPNLFTFNPTAGLLTTFKSSGSLINFQNGTIFLSPHTNLTLQSSGGNIITSAIHTAAGNSLALILDAESGDLTVGTIGTSGQGEFSSIFLTGNNINLNGDLVGDHITFTAGSAINVGGNVIANNNPLSFTKPVTLNASSNISTGTPGSNIIFSGAIDGNSPDAYSLNLDSGSSGSITFDDKIGFNNRLSGLTITNANNVTAQNDIFADAIFQLNATAGGLTAFNGNVTVPTVLGIQLNGSKFSFAGGKTITTLFGGPLIINNSSDLTFAAAATISGSFTQSGNGRTFLSGSIVGDQPVSFNGPITLSGSPSISTSASSQSIFLNGSIDGTSPLDRGNFTIGAGSGSITFNSNIGDNIPIGTFHITNTQNMTLHGVKAKSLQLDGGSGTITTLGTLDMDGVAGIIVTGNNFSINGDIFARGGSLTATNTGTISGSGITTISVYNNFLQNGTGPVFVAGPIITYYGTIEFQSPITIFTPSSLDSTGGGTTFGSDIIFNGVLATLDGTFPLTVSSGIGNIQFQSVGSNVRLGNITINNANNVPFGFLRATGLIQNAGTGTTTFSGPTTITSAAGVNLTGNDFTIQNSFIVQNNGSVTIDNAGLLNLSGATNVSGDFLQNNGDVLFHDTLNAQNAIFNGIVTLSGASSIMTSSLITFSKNIKGGGDLLLNAGSNITFTQPVGVAVRLGNINFTNANNISTKDIKAASITTGGGVTGTASFQGSLDTNTILGINLTGNIFNITGSLITTALGPCIINHSGNLTLNANSSLLSSYFIEHGSGNVLLSGTLHAMDSDITFNNPITLLGPTVLNSDPMNGGDILINNTIDGPQDISLISGNGTITILAPVGGNSPVASFTATGDIINLDGVNSLGPIDVTALSEINLNNSFYNGSSQIYSAGTNINFVAGIPATLNSFGPITFLTPVHLNSGSDLIVNTHNGDFTFQSIDASSSENLTINAALGSVFINSIGPLGKVHNVIVNGGRIIFSAVVYAYYADFEAVNNMFNSAGALPINVVTTATFNALNGDVGTLLNPILVNANLIYAGANNLADFNGISSDNTVHDVPSNPACLLIFNGNIIHSCHELNPTVAIIIPKGVLAPGLESSYFNLSSDYYFLPFFLEKKYFRKDWPIFWREIKQKTTEQVKPVEVIEAAKLFEQKPPVKQPKKNSRWFLYF